MQRPRNLNATFLQVLHLIKLETDFFLLVSHYSNSGFQKDQSSLIQMDGDIQTVIFEVADGS